MSKQRKQARIIHLGKDEYRKLINYGSVIVDGEVIEYRANDIHVTPSVLDESIIVFRHMASEDGSYSVEYSEAGVEMNGWGTSTAYTSVGIFVDTASGGNKLLSFPSKSGTLATTDDCKKLYLHKIPVQAYDTRLYSGMLYLTFEFISARATAYTSLREAIIDQGKNVWGSYGGYYTVNNYSADGGGVLMVELMFSSDGANATGLSIVGTLASWSGGNITVNGMLFGEDAQKGYEELYLYNYTPIAL
jgi:hypothetical protein